MPITHKPKGRSLITGKPYKRVWDFRWKKYGDPFPMDGPFGTRTLGTKRGSKAPYSWVGLKLYSREHYRNVEREEARHKRGVTTVYLRQGPLFQEEKFGEK